MVERLALKALVFMGAPANALRHSAGQQNVPPKVRLLCLLNKPLAQAWPLGSHHVFAVLKRGHNST
jgi:hypothetical protein